jgi:agmatinase
MNKTEHYIDFNPDGTGLRNGNFIGLPFTGESAKVILIPVPWDVTVSYHDGTALAPKAILDASVQLDLFDNDVPDAWKLGIFMRPAEQSILNRRYDLRGKAISYIEMLEKGNKKGAEEFDVPEYIDNHCAELNSWVFNESLSVVRAGKICGIVGGDHSVSLGLVKALADKYKSFGILQVDAHMDMRKKYQGFTFSHASAFYNILQERAVSKLVQVGIRDYCEEEINFACSEKERVSVFFDYQLKDNYYNGMSWNEQCEIITGQLPEYVYLSIDVDGLDPKLCPNTGTPVPGGIDFPQLVYLLRNIVKSGKKIIGFDVCETGNNEWDANVSARIIYKICNLAGVSQGLI